MLRKCEASPAIVSSKNLLVDSFNSGFSVALRLIMDTLNRALEQRTNLIFAELVPSTRVSRLFLSFQNMRVFLSGEIIVNIENEPKII